MEENANGEVDGEIDNCPRCSTTVVMEFGLKAGAFENSELEDSEEEMPWGVCKVCGTKFRRREEFSSEGSVAYYEVWTCWTPEIDLKVVKIHPQRCRWKTIKTKPIPSGSLS